MNMASRIFFACLIALSASSLHAGAGANANWGAANVQRQIAIQSGGGNAGGNNSTDISVWTNRSNVTNGAVNMTAAGDGTYTYDIRLAQGSTYNFTLYCQTNATPPNGLSANSQYYDTVSGDTNAAIVVSGSPSNPSEPALTIARFNYVGATNDSRRVLTVPRSLAAGSTLYVYCNFASTPSAPSNFQANPNDSQSVMITWGLTYGAWGSGGNSFAAADVVAGGSYQIQCSTNSASGPYSNLVTLPGTTFQYVHNGLTVGDTYYYIIMSSDAYVGAYGTTDIENEHGFYAQSSTPSASPQGTRPVRFKVEKPDWDKIKNEYQYLVWLTPEDEDGRTYPYKRQGRIARVYLPPAKNYETERKQR